MGTSAKPVKPRCLEGEQGRSVLQRNPFKLRVFVYGVSAALSSYPAVFNSPECNCGIIRHSCIINVHHSL